MPPRNKNIREISPPKDTQDVTGKVIGDFGKWQLRISVIMGFMKLPVAWYQLNVLFMAPVQDFWCKKPLAFEKYSDEHWRKICAPKMEEYPCLIYDTDLLLFDPDMDKAYVPLMPCKEFEYDTAVFSRTMISEWNLVCTERWKVHLCQVVMMWGILIGGIVFSSIADKRGRRIPLLTAIVLLSVTSLLASIIPWYWLFMLNWFMLAMATGGMSLITFVLCMEVVGGKWRTIISIVQQVPFGLGTAVMSLLAYSLRDWRKLEFALGFLTSLFILSWLWIPESPKWLIATGRTERALDTLMNAANTNNKTITREEVKWLISRHVNPTANKKHIPGFFAFLKSKNMRKKTILLSMNWLCAGLAFYTFAQYLGLIGGNVFMAVALTGSISTIGALTCIYVITAFGRKTTLIIYQAVSIVCFSLILLVRQKYDWQKLVIAGIGFGGMAGSIPALYLYSGEMFPTLGRNRGICGVSAFARLGSMIAPVLMMLENVISGFPLYILVIATSCQILMILPLPETKNKPLPDTIEEAERM